MRKATLFVVVGLMVAVLALAACGGGGGGASQPAASGGAGDAAAGKALFAQTVIGSNPGCVTCHSLEAGKTLVGPSMAGIAGRAGSAVSGQSAEQVSSTVARRAGCVHGEGLPEGPDAETDAHRQAGE